MDRATTSPAFRASRPAFAPMRSACHRILLLGLLLLNPVHVSAEPLRQVVNFNREWLFQLGDFPGAEAESYQDAAWSRVGLPHSFSIPYFAAGGEFYVGYGWYRKHFDVPPEWEGKRLSLEFDGAFQDAEIFLNGSRVGAHQGGYTGFEVDITASVRPGRNVVAVRLNNLWNPRLAPRAGEHAFSGGLYRNVRLVAKAPLHVAWYGTWVTTPEVSAARATVKVRTEIVNAAAEARSCTVQTDVLDPGQQIVATLRTTRTVAAGATEVFEQASEPIARPQLWSPEEPHLYAVKTTVFDAERPVDDCESPLGFRWFEFTADRGFFLNGEHRYFKGANVHQDHAGWGDAVTDAGSSRDVQMIKDAGFDFIRGSHYPHAPAFSSACDRIGVLFWSENAFWGTAGFSSPWGSSAYPTDPADEPGFEASVRSGLREMIRIHRNHPSIVVWSMGNEVFFSAPEVMPKVRRFLKELVAYAHELDPSRPVAVGGSQRGEIDKLGDIAGYNGDGARLFPDPGIPNVVSEYGTTMADRPGEFAPGWGDLPETPGANPSQAYSWRLPWRSGEVIWCGFDHGSVAGRQFGAMGMVDYFRLPKRQWFWYRATYRGIPPPAWPADGVPAALALVADKTTLTAVDGTDDAHLTVSVLDAQGTVLSNCPTVTLAIVSGPGEFPTGTSITFAADTDIPIRDGSAAIEFRSYHAGETVIRATSPGLRDAEIRITSTGGPKYVAGVTPAVAPRPYVRFRNALLPGATGQFGRENPTRASSEAAGHSARNANDGLPWTSWQADAADAGPWMRVDLERVVTLQRVKLQFPTEGAWRFRVELSEDGEHDWHLIANDAGAAGDGTQRTASVRDPAARGRFVRVTLTAWPAGTAPGLTEVEVTGAIAVP